ncbi:hypothetical protein [Rudanella lutea]|uniref:hypothetical protein n=1 Tax=Rudanella lutea TaxID=451374 RepID=UPI0003601557|nr:hypothetical protein [Rudanella lutea]
MKTIELGTKRYRVAECWSELTPEQYRQLIMCPRLPADGSYETLDNEAAACRVWLGMSPKVWQRLELAHWQWGQLRQVFNWLFTTRPEGKPPIDVLNHRGGNYFLPEAYYMNTTAAELAVANMAYIEFAQPIDEHSPDDVKAKHEALDRLVATLCRPRRADWRAFKASREWNGDIREPFRETSMLERAKMLSTLPLADKLLVLDYFERSNNEFLDEYGELFGSDGQPRYGDGRGWLMLLKNVAKQGHFGDFDKVCQQPAHLLFAALLDDMLDQQQAQKEADKQAMRHDH